MPVAAPVAGLVGSAVSGIFGNKAANAQADAAKQAANVQQQALNFQMQSSALNRNDQFPWMATGTNAINTLSHLMGVAGGATNSPWAPTYAGAKPGSPSPFMVGTPEGGAIPGNASSLNPGGNPASGNINPASLNPSSIGMPGSADGLMNPGASMAPGNIMENGQGGNNSMQATAGNAMAMQPGGAGVPAGQPAAAQGSPAGGPQYSGDGSLAQGWTQAFNAPTNITEQNDPGYQARLKMATDAMQNSASARGNLLSGGTAQGLGNLAQDYASNEYGNVYNRALGQYQQNYNIFQNNQANLFNRLSALSGGGQVTAANLAGGQQAAANGVTQNSQAIGQDLNNAAYQRASGYTNTGNAITGGLNNAAALAASLNKGNGTATAPDWGRF